ncbi:hypothetical protein BU14_2346s0001 [Porphyra umbilicalis]|uniref:Uncharacterized protein n=1 Tax=Porphyra umbilicalis TaxID=2786 RepID=A0A1X6NK30_PORUM|nr:hypothetical protein BU14_2346s0001 [Porphyra umbilicalis]|eukprot:OSX68713.1 hypothetical protein BU14_2346s0001 [Porphyra umbilicalis]
MNTRDGNQRESTTGPLSTAHSLCSALGRALPAGNGAAESPPDSPVLGVEAPTHHLPTQRAAIVAAVDEPRHPAAGVKHVATRRDGEGVLPRGERAEAHHTLAVVGGRRVAVRRGGPHVPRRGRRDRVHDRPSSGARRRRRRRRRAGRRCQPPGHGRRRRRVAAARRNEGAGKDERVGRRRPQLTHEQEANGGEEEVGQSKKDVARGVFGAAKGALPPGWPQRRAGAVDGRGGGGGGGGHGGGGGGGGRGGRGRGGVAHERRKGEQQHQGGGANGNSPHDRRGGVGWKPRVSVERHRGNRAGQGKSTKNRAPRGWDGGRGGEGRRGRAARATGTTPGRGGRGGCDVVVTDGPSIGQRRVRSAGALVSDCASYSPRQRPVSCPPPERQWPGGAWSMRFLPRAQARHAEATWSGH